MVGDGGFTPSGHKLRLHLSPTSKNRPAKQDGFWWGMVDLPLRGINFDSTYPPQVKTALRSRTVFGGGWWIRTTEGVASRFTVCPLWPLGKSPKYTMFNWSWWTDSNPRPADYKSAALPAELHQHLTSEPYYNRGFPECQQESSPTERNFIALKLCNLTFKGRCDFLAPSGRGLAARSADWGGENCVLRLSLRRPAGDTSLAEGGKDGGSGLPRPVCGLVSQ